VSVCIACNSDLINATGRLVRMAAHE
jgi:hypothetical protein